MNLLTLGAIDPKFDKVYKVRGDGDEIFHVNVARLECSCAEWRDKRSTFAPGDVRRVCSHVLEKLYTTKVEKNLTLLQQLFVRYGRTMLDCREVIDSLGAFVIGQPFGPSSIRGLLLKRCDGVDGFHARRSRVGNGLGRPSIVLGLRRARFHPLHEFTPRHLLAVLPRRLAFAPGQAGLGQNKVAPELVVVVVNLKLDAVVLDVHVDVE
jgi:hypothetical protein